MLLSFADGTPFATGAIPYDYAPVGSDETPRLLLQVDFEGIRATALVDTGAPYVVCAPAIARLLDLDSTTALEQIVLFIRGLRISGSLYRLTLSFPALWGEPLDVETTVFVPAGHSAVDWGDIPSFIGLTGCLELMRFAVDSATETFFFGPLT